MPRVMRIAGSFAIVVVVYWMYATFAVPWIEPVAELQRGEAITADERARIGGMAELKMRRLEGLFPASQWQHLKDAIIVNLDDNRARLLFCSIANFPDGRVEIHPCIVVFSYDGPVEDDAERLRRSIVLEAPEGAMLQFDPPLDLHNTKPSRLVRGQLAGEITIRSDGKSPGPEDDLRIITHDVQLTEQIVTTRNEVDFSLGPNRGRGREMLMKLLPGKPDAKTEMAGANIAGVESFELQHVERLYLDLGAAVASQSRPAERTPVEVRCRGPFHFDVPQRVATFADQVEVLKSNLVGPRDQILCDTLAICFSQRSKNGSSPNPTPANSGETGLSDLVVERIEAVGNPVTVSAPSNAVKANGQKLVYQLLTNLMTIDGGQEVVLQQGPNEIHARSLQYQQDPAGRLGRVLAQGPGWIRAQPSQQSGQPTQQTDQQIEALWKGQLKVYPDKQDQVIRIDGGAKLNSPGVGGLTAQEICLWLLEGPPKGPSTTPELHPKKMSAQGSVEVQSQRFTARAEKLEAWFVDAAEDARRETVPPGRSSPATAQFLPRPTQPAVGSREPHFEITARLLQVNVLLREQPVVSGLIVEDGVHLSETQTAKPGELPVLLTGDRLEVSDADRLCATAVTIVGRPARFEARGLGLTGSNINLNCGTNHLWIDGDGHMDLPLPADLQGNKPATPSALTVHWQHSMDFDGRVARFDWQRATDLDTRAARAEQSVVAQAVQQQLRAELRTETMEVHMSHPFRFAESDGQPPQAEQIVCGNGVSLEHRAFDQQQQLVSNDHMQLSDLGINLRTGALTGGSGWLSSVRRGFDDGPGDPLVAAIGQNPAAAPAGKAAADQLTGLYVQFQKSISGNLLPAHRRVQCDDQVRASYAPVKTWDTVLDKDNLKVLGPRGVMLRCQQLRVTEMPPPLGDRRSMELSAAGNVKAEGQQFTAQGSRASYDQAKDQLILEGDGRNDAVLFRQLQPGSPRSEFRAGKFIYYPKTNTLKVDDARMLQFPQFSIPGRQPPKGGEKR